MSAEWPLQRLELRVLDLDRESTFFRALVTDPPAFSGSSYQDVCVMALQPRIHDHSKPFGSDHA